MATKRKSGLAKAGEADGATTGEAPARIRKRREPETAVIQIDSIKVTREDVESVVYDGSGKDDELGSWRDGVAVTRTALREVAAAAVHAHLEKVGKKLRAHRAKVAVATAERKREEIERELAEAKKRAAEHEDEKGDAQ